MYSWTEFLRMYIVQWHYLCLNMLMSLCNKTYLCDLNSWDAALSYKHIITMISGEYRKISNIRRTLVGNTIVDHSDVVGASPVGAAPTTSSFSTQHLAPRYSAKTAARQYENILSAGIWCALY